MSKRHSATIWQTEYMKSVDGFCGLSLLLERPVRLLQIGKPWSQRSTMRSLICWKVLPCNSTSFTALSMSYLMSTRSALTWKTAWGGRPSDKQNEYRAMVHLHKFQHLSLDNDQAQRFEMTKVPTVQRMQEYGRKESHRTWSKALIQHRGHDGKHEERACNIERSRFWRLPG